MSSLKNNLSNKRPVTHTINVINTTQDQYFVNISTPQFGKTSHSYVTSGGFVESSEDKYDNHELKLASSSGYGPKYHVNYPKSFLVKVFKSPKPPAMGKKIISVTLGYGTYYIKRHNDGEIFISKNAN